MDRIIEETPEILEANKRADPRHRSGTSVAPPSIHGLLEVVRCAGCRRLMTQWEICRWGACPTCESHRFHGAVPSRLENVRLTFWEFFGNWRVWGWNPEELKEMPWLPKMMRKVFPLKERDTVSS